MRLREILRSVKPTPAAYLNEARCIETGAFEELRRVNVAILSTFTSEPLRPYLVVEGAARGLLIKPYFSPFNQLEQQALDRNSFLYASRPDVVVIATRLEEVAPSLATRFLTLSGTAVEEELAGIESRIQSLIEGLRRFTPATILVFNYASPAYLSGGLADPLLDVSQVSVVQQANARVAKICRQSSGVYMFDYSRIVYEIGLRRWSDPRFYYLGRIPFGVEAQIETGRRLARSMRAIFFPPCKCLVVDLDKVLWGGVLGEEGLEGIALGEDYPGNVYKDFQRRLLSLRDRGVLLAIASKNNESDVMEVLRKHPDQLLKAEDFAAIQINWQDKATSLATIAEELNVGTSALAFFDDNPVEREWVRSQMPEVTVIEVPEDPMSFGQALEESGAFDQLVISVEDRERIELYRKERKRKQLHAQSTSLEEFLRQLDMTADVSYVGTETLPRVTQLLAKTNQFNLTTRRHAPSELDAMIKAGAIALRLRLTDRYGENGVVGVAIALPGESDHWTVDTFLLSCRVIGRRVESVLLGILSHVIRARGGKIILGEYIATSKNAVVADFYSSHGFEPMDKDARLWQWDLSKGELPLPGFVKLNFEDETGRRG